eukprot:scaffold770_cov255-Pinguiococcus_pyrenoidosus.AAC.71
MPTIKTPDGDDLAVPRLSALGKARTAQKKHRRGWGTRAARAGRKYREETNSLSGQKFVRQHGAHRDERTEQSEQNTTNHYTRHTHTHTHHTPYVQH